MSTGRGKVVSRDGVNWVLVVIFLKGPSLAASPEASYPRKTEVGKGRRKKGPGGPFCLCLVFSAVSAFPRAPLESGQWNEGGFLEQFLFPSPTQALISHLIRTLSCCPHIR